MPRFVALQRRYAASAANRFRCTTSTCRRPPRRATRTRAGVVAVERKRRSASCLPSRAPTAVRVRRRRAEPLTVRSRSLVSSIAHHACLRGYGASPRARIRRPGCSAPYQLACRVVLARSSTSRAYASASSSPCGFRVRPAASLPTHVHLRRPGLGRSRARAQQFDACVTHCPDSRLPHRQRSRVRPREEQVAHRSASIAAVPLKALRWYSPGLLSRRSVRS